VSYNVLTGTIPPILSQASSLQQLSVAANHLTGTIPSSLGSLAALLTLDVSLNELTGTIPDALGTGDANLEVLFIEFNSISGTFPPGLANHVYLESINALTKEGQLPLMGGCFPPDFLPPSCRLSQNSMFSCSCDAPSWCGQCPCYKQSGQEICDQNLHRCRRGCSCVPTTNWYTCSCPTDVVADPPEYTCERNNECQLYGCGNFDPEAACIEAGPNERYCLCPAGFMPDLTNSTANNETGSHLISDEMFGGCVERPPFLTGGQIAGICVGAVAGSVLWFGMWYAIGSATGGGSGVSTDYVTL